MTSRVRRRTSRKTVGFWGWIDLFENRCEHQVPGCCRLEGEVGIVDGGDVVRHGLESDAPVRALVIWVPGGEIDRLIRGGFKPVAE